MPEIVEITGIGPALATACVEAGFSRVDEIASAAPVELAAVPGIGEMRAVTLIKAAQSLLNGAQAPRAEDTPGVKTKKQAKAKAGKSKKNRKKQKKKQKKNKKKNGKGKNNSKKNNSKSGKNK